MRYYFWYVNKLLFHITDLFLNYDPEMYTGYI